MNLLRHFRDKAGLTQQALADQVHTSQPQILRLEKSKRKLTKEWAERLAPALGVSAEVLMFPPVNFDADPGTPGWVIENSDGIDVPGDVAAGRYLTIETASDEAVYERVPVTPDARYAKAAQFGLVVRGTSINNIAVDGDVLHCVDLAEAGITPQNGDLVVVEQIQFAGHLRERTAKIFHKGEHEMIELRPDSTDERWQEPIIVPHRVLDWRPREDLQVVIRAVVIGAYRPMQRRRV